MVLRKFKTGESYNEMGKSEDKSLPDVLRVMYYILENKGSPFSLQYAAESKELNGINIYRIAEIIRETCLQPEGPNSIKQYTTIDKNNFHNLPSEWELTAESYFNFLSYESLNAAKLANEKAHRSVQVAIGAIVVSLVLSVPSWLGCF